MAEYKSSGTDTVVKIVLVFFISLLSFSIGTFVGKKFSDNQHKMVSMEPSKVQKDDASHELAAEAEIDSTSTHASSDAHESSKPTNSAVGHEADPITDDQVAVLEEEMGSSEELASTVEKSTSNTEIPKISKVLAKEVADNGGEKFTIQIASYPSQEEADKKVNELKALKFDSFSTEASIKGHQWYRVNVGVFATIKEAQDQKVVLAERAKISTSFIHKLKK
jgi:septal ring-binding cell division protein DamX